MTINAKQKSFLDFDEGTQAPIVAPAASRTLDIEENRRGV